MELNGGYMATESAPSIVVVMTLSECRSEDIVIQIIIMMSIG